MNKKQKIELGQKLVDLIYEVDGHIDIFLEECLDWKYVKENHSPEDLTMEYEFKYPTWSVCIVRNFDPPDDDHDEDDEYKDFGVMKNEQVDFNGDGEDFKEWLKENMPDVYDGFNNS
jgi:hypothetical protein